MNLLVDRETLRCPTCRAVQPWSDTCRRCKCDLRLLRAAAEAYQDHRRRCLAAIAAGKPDAALIHACQCYQLRSDETARRLLAVCALLVGDWTTAVTLSKD